MWNQNLRLERSQSKRFQHAGPKVSLCNREAWAQPLAGTHHCALLLCILLLGNGSCSAIGQCLTGPHPQATNYQWATYWYLSCSAIGQHHSGPCLLVTVNEGPLGKWFSQESVVRWWPDSCLWGPYFFFLIQECISGRWGKLSFLNQYESWSVLNNSSGGDI